MQTRQYQDHSWVEFENGVSVEILRKERTYAGIGRVKCGRRDLRSPRLPILPLIETTGGYRVCRLEIDEISSSDEELTITFRPYVVVEGPMEEDDGRGRRLWNAGPWTREPTRDRGGKVWLRLKAVCRDIQGLKLCGVSYGYKFRSRKYQIRRLHDRATWELDRRSTGNSLYARCHPHEPRKTIRNKKDHFTTARARNGRIAAQFRSLFADLQGFTFQFDRKGLLVTAFDEPFPCMSLVQKEEGHNEIVHWHQLCAPGGEPTGCIEFPSLGVMYADSETESQARRLGQYDAVRSALWEDYYSKLGLEGQQSGCWGELEGAIGASEAQIRAGLDELSDAACSKVMLCDLLHAPSEQGARRAARVAAEFARSRRLELGASLEPSSLDTHRDEQPEGPEDPWSMALSEQVGKLKEHFSLSVLHGSTSDGAPLEGQRAHSAGAWRFENAMTFREALRKHGCRCGGGGRDMFGLSRPDTSYPLLRHNELMYQGMSVPFPYEAVVAAGDDPCDAYFRGYAGHLCYRVRCRLGHGSGSGLAEWWSDEFVAVNKAYRVVCEHMRSSGVLERGRGILWAGGETTPQVLVLWSFKSFKWEVGEGASVYDVMGAGVRPVKNGVVHVKRRRVYLVENAQEPESPGAS